MHVVYLYLYAIYSYSCIFYRDSTVCYVIAGGFEALCDVVYVVAAKSLAAVCWVIFIIKYVI